MSNFQEYKLSELYNMSSGISSKPEQAGHGEPFLSFRTIFNNFYLPEELEDLMNVNENEMETYSIKKGDVFLTRTSETLNELAMSSVAIKDYPRATFSGFAKRLRPIDNNKIYDKFMAFYFRSLHFRKSIDNNATMTLRASFNEEIFSYLKLNLPQYPTQIKVGDLLYRIEEKIRLNIKINQELFALAKTIYDYWFVQFDFPNEEGKPYKSSGGVMVYNEVLKREIPLNWKVISIFKCTDLVYGYPFSTELFDETKPIGGKNVIRIRDIIDNSTSAITAEIADEKYLTKNMDLLIGMDGNFHMNFWHSNNDYVNQRIVRIRKNEYDISNMQIYHEIMPFIKAKEKNNARSTVAHLSDKDMKQLFIMIPKKGMNVNPSRNLDNILNKICNNRKINQLLSEARDWLLPMLMNGQVIFK